ncbi:MAG: hypothetical protein NZL92_06765 [Gloeomargarita sp. SKYG116]|nr:hypothetical protein [Gloeomargarita sp. SKYG116]MDW8401380.1 hypothetical protein [Gloeomargarita sp. SKYGB_i_bin116]
MSSWASRVTTKVLGWLKKHLYRFNPFTSGDGVSEARQTALAELALLCFELSQNPRAETKVLALAIRGRQVLEAAYRQPELHKFIHRGPEQAFNGHLLMWLALPRPVAESMVPKEEFQAVFDHRAIAHAGWSPMRLLELRYFLDYSGLHHNLPTPRLLLEEALDLSSLDPYEMSVTAIYDLTHVIFYATHFGRWPGAILTGTEREHLAALILVLQDRLINQKHWDLVAEIILSRRCLCLPDEQLATEPAWYALAQAQEEEGAYNAQLLQQLLVAQGMELELAADYVFLRCYHPCLVTAMAGLFPEPLI